MKIKNDHHKDGDDAECTDRGHYDKDNDDGQYDGDAYDDLIKLKFAFQLRKDKRGKHMFDIIDWVTKISERQINEAHYTLIWLLEYDSWKDLPNDK